MNRTKPYQKRKPGANKLPEPPAFARFWPLERLWLLNRTLGRPERSEPKLEHEAVTE